MLFQYSSWQYHDRLRTVESTDLLSVHLRHAVDPGGAAGLATLTHTPNPMTFLARLLERPSSEKPVMLIVTGYPSPDARVPRLTRKDLADIATFR